MAAHQPERQHAQVNLSVKKVFVCKEYSVLSGEQEKSLQVDLYQEVMRARKEMGIALQELGNVEPRSSVLIIFFSVLVHFLHVCSSLSNTRLRY